MYEQSSRWNTYYRELEPERRLALFEKLSMTEPDDGANAYRRLLFARRYEDEKTPGTYVDRFLFQCVNMIQVYKSARFFKKSAGREVDRTFQDLLLDLAPDYGECGEKALYWEIRNAAERYFKTCQSDSYGRSLFGFLKSGDTNRRERMGRDAWEMSEGVSRRLQKQEQMRIWNAGIKDAYLCVDPAGAARWENMERENE